MLSSAEIRRLIELTQLETVVPESPEFPFRVVKRRPGYADDSDMATLQATLSIMLEVALRREGR